MLFSIQQEVRHLLIVAYLANKDKVLSFGDYCNVSIKMQEHPLIRPGLHMLVEAGWLDFLVDTN